MNRKKTTSHVPVDRWPPRLVAILSIGLLFLAGVAILGAQSDIRDVDTIVDEILQNQGASNIQNVDPNQVDTELLRELGEAVMDRNQKAWREDPARVEEANRGVGYRYLRNGGEPSWLGSGPGMMGPGMMGFGRSGTRNDGNWAGPDRGARGSSRWHPGMMDGWSDYSRGQNWLPPWAWVLLAILLIVVAILAIVLFTRRGENKNRGGGAMDIARDRYARGEITREEFERIRVVLE